MENQSLKLTGSVHEFPSTIAIPAEIEHLAVTKAEYVVVTRSIFSTIFSVQECMRAIQESRSIINFRFGCMFACKTDGTLRDVSILKELFALIGKTIHIFKVKGDNRYGTNDSTVASKAEKVEAATAVSHIVEITQKIQTGEIKPGDAIVTIELPFMCMKFKDEEFIGFDLEALERFINLVRKRDIILIADGLEAWFNTIPLEPVIMMLRHADLAFYMQAYDSFDPERLADATLRCSRVVQTRDSVVALDKGKYYASLSVGRLDELIEKSRRSGLISETLLNWGRYDEDGIEGECYFMPSHPNDPRFLIGDLLYMPTTKVYMKAIYDALGFPFEPTDTEEFLGQFGNIFDWRSVNL